MIPGDANDVVGRTRDDADNGGLRGCSDGRTDYWDHTREIDSSPLHAIDRQTSRLVGNLDLRHSASPAARQSDSKHSELLLP